MPRKKNAGRTPANTPKRSRSVSRSRAGTPRTTQALERFQSSGMFRPTRDLGAPLGKGILVSQTFASRGKRNSRAKRRTSAQPPPIVAAYVDPWDEDAVGVRYPDAFDGLSGTFTGTYVTNISSAPAPGYYTDANMSGVSGQAGSALFFATPDPSNCVVQGVCGVPSAGSLAGIPNTFVWPNGIAFTGAPKASNAFGPGTGMLGIDNTIGNIPSMRQLYSSGRLVAGGIKLTSTMNFSTVSGTIHMAPYSYNLNYLTNTSNYNNSSAAQEAVNGWQCVLPNTLSSMSALPGYVQYPLSSLEQDEMVAVFKRFGDEAKTFKQLNGAWGLDDGDTGDWTQRTGDASIPSTVGHYGILVFVEGVLSSTGGLSDPGTPLLDLEYRCQYECQPTSAALIYSGNGGTALTNIGGTSICSQAPPYQPVLMAAADNMMSQIPAVRCVDDAGVEEGGFLDEVSRLWSNACSIASSVSTVVGPVAGMLSALAL